jgi:hypothetical protein
MLRDAVKKEGVSKVRYTLFLFGYLMETGDRLSDSQALRLFLIHPLKLRPEARMLPGLQRAMAVAGG